MHRKSLFFGMGLGILCTVAIAFGAYAVQRRAFANEAALSLASPPLSDDADKIDPEYLVIRAREMGMVFPDEIVLPDNSTVNNNGYCPDETPDALNANDNDEYNEHYENDYEDTNDATDPDETVGDDVGEEPYRYVQFTISPGASATEFAARAAEAGLVPNAEEFLSFLETQGYTHSIRAGVFYVPRGASFWDIVNIVVYGN